MRTAKTTVFTCIETKPKNAKIIYYSMSQKSIRFIENLKVKIFVEKTAVIQQCKFLFPTRITIK